MAKIQEFINPNLVKNLGNELLNVVGKTVDSADTGLYERKTLNFRDIIDNNFPTMLIVDYDNIKKELQLYQDIETSLKQYIYETYKPTEKDYNINKLSSKEIDLIIKIIKRAIPLVSATPISYKNLQTQLSDIVKTQQATNTVIIKTKALFNKIYRLTDNIGNGTILIFPNFAKVSDILRGPLDIATTAITTEAETEISVDSIGKILAYGHTAAGYIDKDNKVVLNFNSPKLIAIMFDVISAASDKSNKKPQDPLEAATFFVEDTRQTELFLTIDKNFSDDFLKLFISVGGNIVRFENSLINSRRGTVLEKTEKRGVNKAVLERLARAFSNTQTAIGSRLSRYILNRKSSPNLLDYINYTVVNTLKGNNVFSYKSKAKDSLKLDKKIIKRQISSGLVKIKTKLPKQKIITTKIPSRQLVASLINLQNLLDSSLHEKIRQNMGTGNRRDVLNYRSGRFAQSVKVERLSESRQGMITAFYSYMKNPYATFSQGGRQELPRSRDPKLLISKSIREIAGTLVANRLRAVNI